MRPVQILESVVRDLRVHEEMCSMVDRVRRIDESSKDTLQRVLEDRGEIVKLFKEYGIKNGEYDYSYHDWQHGRLLKQLVQAIEQRALRTAEG